MTPPSEPTSAAPAPAGQPGRARWQSLAPQLFLFVVLPLASLLVAVVFGSLALHGQAMRALVSQRDERAARAAAAALGEGLRYRAGAVQNLALHLNESGATGGVLAPYAFLRADFDGGLAVFAPDGSLVDALDSSEWWAGRPVAALIAQTLGQADVRFSDAFRDQASGGWMILAASAASGSPPGRQALVVVGAFSPAGLARNTLAPGAAPGDQPFVLIVDRGGRILYQQGRPPDEADLARHPGVAEALGGLSGGMYRQAGDGDEHVIAFSGVTPVGWALVLEEPWEDVDSPLLRLTQSAPLILVPVLIAALIALGFGLRQIVQPLRRLEQQTSQLARGRFDAADAPVGGIAEIRRLQAEIGRMARQVQASQRNLRHYLGALTAGQEDERRRLARELHDGTVQALVALDQRAQLAQMALKEAPPDLRERLADLRRMTAALVEDVRRILRALRPAYLEDLGLLPALEMLVRDLGVAGPPATFAVHGQPRRLTAAQEITLYRIMQEALTNAARHASAGSVAVSAAFEPAGLTIRVTDDGLGFTAPERVGELAAAGHYGLMGMQERAELIGARLTIASAPGAGTTIELHLPLEAA